MKNACENLTGFLSIITQQSVLSLPEKSPQFFLSKTQTLEKRTKSGLFSFIFIVEIKKNDETEIKNHKQLIGATTIDCFYRIQIRISCLK